MSIQALPRQQVQVSKPLIEGKKFDIIFCLSVLWLIGGTFTDAWAHNNIPRLETFWTPWHAILYSGLVFLISSVTAVVIINYRRCGSWARAIPRGYKLAYLAFGFMVLDIVWVSSTMHVVWTTHMLIGSVYILLMIGWGLSYLPYPPQRPAATDSVREEL